MKDTMGDTRGAGRKAVETVCTRDLKAGDAIASVQRSSTRQKWMARLIPRAARRLPPGVNRPGIAGQRRMRLDPHALAASAKEMQKTNNVVLAFSSGSSSQFPGWREMLDLAGAQALPMIFVERDDLLDRSAPARPPAQKQAKRKPSKRDPAGHGFPAIPVDGEDAIAVYRVAQEAIRRARQGGGPTLIECKVSFPRRATHVPNRQVRATGLEQQF